jgi:pyrroline-5-carboxylate reductase
MTITEDANTFPGSLLLIGAGKMGGAMLRGWLNHDVAPDRLSVIEPQPDPALIALCAARGVILGAPVHPPEAVLLAIKPQMLEESVTSITPYLAENTLIVSILAGKTLADLGRRFGAARPIVRAMPNLPASVGRGMTGAVANSSVTPVLRHAADAILSGAGQVEWLDEERLIDALTAISGSGPAYVFYFVECLAAAGVEAGLTPELAMRLARATIEGAGALLTAETQDSGTLRRNVTSPGGTTAAALEVLMAEEGLASLLRRAVLAAKRRSEELSG